MKRARDGVNGRRLLGRAWLLVVFLFLYLPMAALVVFSFNRSRLQSQWGGFSLDWYARLADDTQILDGLRLSLEIAVLSATGSILLGTLAAYAFVKYPRFRGRTFFSALASAPLVMPEVIQGFSLLLMLVALQRAIGFPERGLVTIWLGHLLVGMAYATVVVQTRLQMLNPEIEEAAMDLGARPARVFASITLPMISQALVSAWFLTFSLSLDDVVVSAFLSGPGATTLPLVIFSRARLGLDPSVNAVASVIIFVVAVFAAAASVWMIRAERRRAAEMASTTGNSSVAGRNASTAAPPSRGEVSARDPDSPSLLE